MASIALEIDNTDHIAAFARLRDQPFALLLDSADLGHAAGRYSFIAAAPAETITAKNGQVTWTRWHERKTLETDPFAFVQERLSAWDGIFTARDDLPPFQGGAAGFWGYDLVRSIEKLPAIAVDNPAMPDMAIGIYDQVLAYDHEADKAWLITHAATQAEAETKQRQMLKILSAPAPADHFAPVHLEWESNFEAQDYMDMVETVVGYIKAGDIFQANLSQRFEAALPEKFDIFGHYRVLRKINPAPFAGYMDLGDAVLSSASPERFLTVKDGAVETCPIKGTRPHVEDPVLDQVYKKELERSDKDRAENIMIVDLLRNDLSKVCLPESVQVPSLCHVESFASVHHLVSVVQGRLRAGQGACDLLRACFPGGSITGAPKIRAMEIIEELEPTRRGPYCGALGYIGFDGTMDTNILIRTLVFDKNAGRVSFQTGGGITVASDPDEEYQETFFKADAIFRSFEGEALAAEYREVG